MKQQYIKLFSFLLGLSFIISGVLFTVVSATVKEDKKKAIEEDSKIADEIGNVYDTFFEKEKALSSYRNSLNKDISNYVVFYTDMPDGYQKIIDEITKYDTYVKEVNDVSSYLSEKCSKNYSVLEANEKCSAYYINMEKTINSFIGDIEFFNSKIDEFNKWAEKENNSLLASTKYKKLDKYISKDFTSYVDLNGDGTFLGMNAD